MSVTAPTSTDAQLLPLAAAGNPDSLAELYGRHRDGALAVAISVLADIADAEDVVQDVFVQLPRMARSYDPARGEPAQWLLRSVRNRAIDHYRRRARRQHQLAPSADENDRLELIPAPGTSPDEDAEAEEFLELLGRLDARHAQLIRLAFVEGWSHSAISGITGLPLGTVKSRIRVGLRLFRSLVAEMDVTPRKPAHEARTAPAPLVVVTGDATFGARIRSLARGITEIEVAAELPTSPARRPSAVVFDTRAKSHDSPPHAESLDEVGWRGVPALVWGGRWRVHPLEREPDGRAATAYARVFRGSASALVAALLSTASDPVVRRAALDRLLHADDLAVLLGDRLGRVTAATRAAAVLFDRSQRDLVGASVTELSAMPKGWTERQWQRLAGEGWWSGGGMVRLSDGSHRAIGSVAWLVPSGGFLTALVALDS